MLAQLLTRGYTPEYIPQCPRAVETWLKTASVNVASVRAACQGTGHGVKYATDEDTRPPTPTDAPAAEAVSLVTTESTGADHGVLLHIAALYIVVRAYRKLTKTQRMQVPKTALMKRLFAIDQLPDMSMLQAAEDYRSNVQKTYASTDDCLKGVHDEGLRTLFRKHTQLTALRKHLLLRRKPTFFQHRRLLNEHLVRTDGKLRTSIAEIAYAVKHEWNNKSVMDAAVSKFAAMMSRMGQAFL